VVAHPEGVESVLLGEAGAFDEEVLVRLQPEVRNEQAEPGHVALLL